MVKGINKLSKSQKKAPAKTQTRISAFFSRGAAPSQPCANPAPAADPIRPAQTSVMKPPALGAPGSAMAAAAGVVRPPAVSARPPAAGVVRPPAVSARAAAAVCGRPVRRSPRKAAERSGEGVLNGVVPNAAPREVEVISLDESCELFPATLVPEESGVLKENRLRSPSLRREEVGDDAEKGSDGVKVVNRLSKRPVRTGLGVSPDPKRIKSNDGMMRLNGVKGESGGGKLGSDEIVKREGVKSELWKSDKLTAVRDISRELDDATRQDHKDVPVASDEFWRMPAPKLDEVSSRYGESGTRDDPQRRVPRASGAPTPPESESLFSPVKPQPPERRPEEAVRTPPADLTGLTPPQSERRAGTPERDDSQLLFESVDDLEFSPFKEETAARAPPLLRSADPSVAKWRRFDRYTVSLVERRPDGSLVVSLAATEPGQPDRTITLRGSWSTTHLEPGDPVHVLQAPSDVIDSLAGQLVVRPDRLVSGTSVVSAVFCARKAVLSELCRGLEPGNRAMLVGTLVHQLFQEVIWNQLKTVSAVKSAISGLLGQSSIVSSAYGSGVEGSELAGEIDQFVAPILGWVRRYTDWGRYAEVPISTGQARPPSGDVWDGKVTELKDIEENYWSPRLGIKGKIDLTVEVKCRNRVKQVVPLELKTGKASFSAEHQGQVTLYSMMTSERRDDPGSGFLLYLRTGAMREVCAGLHQQRDLLQLRNHLVHHLSAAPETDDQGELTLPPLPAVIDNERACQRCPHLLACSAYQRPEDPAHAVPAATSHLSASHLSYFLHWSALLRLEMSCGAARVSMSRLWTQPAAERQARGQAAAAAPILGVQRSAAGWRHRLARPPAARCHQMAAGDLVVISTDEQLALVMGTLQEVNELELCVLLDRDLTAYPGWRDRLYHVDRAEYQQETTMGTYFSSLARLLENTEHSRRLRELIVDRAAPSYLPGLGRMVITKCRAILRPLNKLQQRALLRVLMAEDYLLILGMPGTGKTSTIVALVRLLVTMGRSVLLASYTNSAVDTVLLKLKEMFTDFVRLGRSGRVHPELQQYCSETLTANLNTPEQMAEFYNARPVVATTCLGVNHPVFQRRKFDICIIDEASQTVQPAALAPLLLAERFVLVGDPRQLPPVIQSSDARRRGMDESLFARLAADDNTVQLTAQYRMNRALTAAANHLTYEGKLTCGSDIVAEATLPSVERKASDPVWLSAALDPALERSLVLLDTSALGWQHTSDRHGDVSNAAEAALVAAIARHMVQRGLAAGSVGVIAPYRGQVKLLRAALPEPLEVNTVDQYQGRDKDVILYSCTRTERRRSPHQDTADSADILCDERRLTVAVTRAKHKLVLVGARDALASYPPFLRLFQHLSGADVIRLSPAQVAGLPALS